MKKFLVLFLALVVLAAGAFLISCDDETPDNNGGGQGEGDQGGGQNEYTVTFKADGSIVDTKTFSSVSEHIDPPSVPSKTGYTGSWESFTLSTENLTINAVYTPIVYKITFVNGSETVKVCEFTVENTSIDAPEVPAKQCHTGAWDNYDLTLENKTVYARYSAAHENIVHKPEQPSTCASVGYKKHFYCSKCQNYYSNATGTVQTSLSALEIPEKSVCNASTLEFINATTITCKDFGQREHWKCPLCSKTYADALATTKIDPKIVRISCNYVNGKCVWCNQTYSSSYLSYGAKLTELGIVEGDKRTWCIPDTSALSLFVNGTIAPYVSAVIKSDSNEYSHLHAASTSFGKMLLMEGGSKECETYLDIVPGPTNTSTFFKGQSFVYEFDYMRGEASEDGLYPNMSIYASWRGGSITYSNWGMLNFTPSGGLRLSEYGKSGRGEYGETKEFVTAKDVLYNVAVYYDLNANTVSLYVDGVKWDECKFLENESDSKIFGVTHIRFWCSGVPSGSQIYIDNYMHYVSESGPLANLNPYKTHHYGFRNDNLLLKINYPKAWSITKGSNGYNIILGGEKIGSFLGMAASDTSYWTVLHTKSYKVNSLKVTEYTEQKNGSTETRYRYVYKYTEDGHPRTVTLTVDCSKIDEIYDEMLYSNVSILKKTESNTVGALSELRYSSSILILGNSFIRTSNIGSILSEMLDNNGKNCSVTAVSRGYASVGTYTNDASMMQSIRAGQYDAVFICGFYSESEVANLGILKSACDASGTKLIIFPAHNESASAISAAKNTYSSLYCLDWKSELDTLIARGVNRWDLCINDAHYHSTPFAGYVGAHMIYRAIYSELPTVPMRYSINQNNIDSVLGNYSYVGDGYIVSESQITYFN